jgi:lipopolysaccharide transport system ATP-binding protein
MSPIVISVEHLSKTYRLGQIGTGTLANDLKVYWARKLGRPNPLLTVGEADHGNRDGEMLWALKDVNFQVEQGEVLGIIGRNGAGKSTLLKILSCVTAPTGGCVKVRGRIASLLEVGTGFHPDLTGRENIFLNGAILGMTTEEVRRKMDEIVAFAEIEQFLDTPVKRYSSGMYVRLAFAVAAHLDPEILVVDEVLAVGDAEFQKKCLGKMGDISTEGKTVLFVSHNMQSINRLCRQGIWLDKGILKQQGNILEVTSNYLKTSIYTIAQQEWKYEDALGDETARLKAIRVLCEGKICDMIPQDAPITIEMEYWNLKQSAKLQAVITLMNEQGVYLIRTVDENEAEWGRRPRPSGIFKASCTIPGNLFVEGRYSVIAEVSTFGALNYQSHFLCRDSAGFHIVNSEEGIKWGHSFPGIGVIRPPINWHNEIL